MYFSRITINARTAEPADLVKLLGDNAYTIHQVLWRLFPQDMSAQRDFLFRRETGNGWPFFYMLSKRRPHAIDGLVQVESKPYQPQLSTGDRLAFCLRANPVVTKKSADGQKRYRHDVVMNAKHELAGSLSHTSEISAAQLQYTVGIKWLTERAAHLGFTFDPDLVTVFGYQQHRIKSRKQKRDIRFSVLDYKGILSVTEPHRFHQTLINGIGRAKAFGCGLLLIRRI